MKQVWLAAMAGAAMLGAFGAAQGAQGANELTAARYDAEGQMLFPEDYRSWIFLSSGRGMSYSDVAADQPEPVFDNVFVNPAAYRAFLRDGIWPDGTVLVLEIRSGTSHGSILESGSFQVGDALRHEMHVKDTARFGGDGWAFFGFRDQTPAAMIAKGERCYVCHEANAAADTTFVQFYPTLLPIAREKGTLSAAYLAAEAAGRGVGE